MPRTSSRSSSNSKYLSKSSSNTSYSYSSPKSPIVAPISSPISTVSQSQVKPGFLSNVFQGFALGTGQSIAMNMFRSDPKVTHTHENASSDSSLEKSLPKEFVQCMKESNNDKEACKSYLE